MATVKTVEIAGKEYHRVTRNTGEKEYFVETARVTNQGHNVMMRLNQPGIIDLIEGAMRK